MKTILLLLLFSFFRIRKVGAIFLYFPDERGSSVEEWKGIGGKAKGGGVAVCDSALSSVAWSRHTRALIINELMVD